MVEHALLLILVAVHHHGAVQYALHVSALIQIGTHLCTLMIFSYLYIVLSKRWHMQRSQHLNLYIIMERFKMHYT